MSVKPDWKHERGMNMDFYTAFYDMNENCVFVWMTDSSMAMRKSI